MADEKKIFFPLFYNSLELTESLSDEEFGKLTRELLRSAGKKEYSANLEPKLTMAYNFMLDSAIRIFTTYAKPKYYSHSAKPKNKEYNFDPDEAFEKALARSYEGEN